MLSMQHAMLAYRQFGRDISPEFLGGALYPDAIRCYGVPRRLTHFERSDDGSDSSWWSMPTDMRHWSPDLVELSLKARSHKAVNASAPFGQDTDIGAFIEHNKPMRAQPDMYRGVMTHLQAQDVPFDSFVREHVIDVSEMSEGRLYMQPDVLEHEHVPRDVQFDIFDGGRALLASDADARRLVTYVEQQGIYVLAAKVYDERGITCDQAFFDGSVRDRLSEAYSEELTERTMAYMRVDAVYDNLIRLHDFDHLDAGPLPASLYDGLYDDCSARAEAIYESGGAARHARVIPSNLAELDDEMTFDDEEVGEYGC